VFIVALLKYSARTAITVAIGLGQIGEFSFILSQVARDHHLMPEEGHNVLVAVAIISITFNPAAFGRIDAIESWLKKRPRLWKLLNARADEQMHQVNAKVEQQIAASEKPLAIIVGYGPVGRVVDALLRDTGLETVIIDTNMETISSLTSRGRRAIFGDATHMAILEQAGLKKAVHLVITLPHSGNRGPLILAARQINPDIEVTVRSRYLAEREALREAGASTIVSEEGEAGLALARQVMKQRKIDEPTIQKMLTALRRMWRIGD
jgi:CPA2 family monovalent cation:H+ antiporter-2